MRLILKRRSLDLSKQICIHLISTLHTTHVISVKSVRESDNCYLCTDSSIVAAMRLNCYLESEDMMVKTVFFNEPISSILGYDCNKRIRTSKDDVQRDLLQLVGKKLCLKVKLEKRMYTIEDQQKVYVQASALTPAFVLKS